MASASEIYNEALKALGESVVAERLAVKENDQLRKLVEKQEQLIAPYGRKPDGSPYKRPPVKK